MDNDIFRQFAATWDIFMEKKLPSISHSRHKQPSGDSDGETPEFARPMTPLVGALAGIMVFLPGWILFRIFGNIPAGIAVGVLGPLFLEYLTGWNGLKALSSYINMRQKGCSQEEAILGQTDSSENTSQPQTSTATFLTIYVMRMAMFGALAYCGASFWIVVALTGGYLVRAELSSVVMPNTESPLLDAPEKMKKWHWYIAMGIVLLFSLLPLTHMAMALTAIGICWIISWYCSNLCLETISGITPRAVEIFGYATEIVLFVLGILLLTGHR